MFEQFTQLNSSNAIGPKGLGLGLNIAQSLACLLKHQINLKSQENHGCLFSINVPICDPPNIKNISTPPARMNLNGVGVLCIDNEKAILQGMTELLTAWQCQVYTAINAKQARDIYAKHEDSIDILLVDYQLTGSPQDTELYGQAKYTDDNINGIALIKQIRAMSQHSLPAILISATTDEKLKSLAQQADVGYLRKIIKPIALRALMSSLLTKELEKNYSHLL